MKKTFLFTVLFLLVGSLAFSLAGPVELVLNTNITAVSSLTVNGQSTTSSMTISEANIGTSVNVGYTYQGNQPVSIRISSANVTQGNTSFRLLTSPANIPLPYSLTIDPGTGIQVAVTHATPINLKDTDGVYDLSCNLVVKLSSGNYPAGAYADTLTFEVVAQ